MTARGAPVGDGSDSLTARGAPAGDGSDSLTARGAPAGDGSDTFYIARVSPCSLNLDTNFNVN